MKQENHGARILIVLIRYFQNANDQISQYKYKIKNEEVTCGNSLKCQDMKGLIEKMPRVFQFCIDRSAQI